MRILPLTFYVLIFVSPAPAASVRRISAPMATAIAKSWPNFQPGNQAVGTGGGGYNATCSTTVNATNVAESGSASVTVKLVNETFHTIFRMDNATGFFPGSEAHSSGNMRFFHRSMNPTERSDTKTINAGETVGFGFTYFCPFSYSNSTCSPTHPKGGAWAGQVNNPTGMNFQNWAVVNYHFQVQVEINGNDGAIVASVFGACDISPMADVQQENASFFLNYGRPF